MKSKLALGTAILMMVTGLAGCQMGSVLGKQPETEEPTILEVIETDIQNRIFLTGNVVTDQSREITSETGGKVVKVEVAIGDQVMEGQVLAVLDDTDLKDSIRDKELAIAIERENLSQTAKQSDEGLFLTKDAAVKDLEEAQAKLGKYEALYSQGGVTLTEVEGYRTEVRKAQDAVESARLSISQSTRASQISVQKKNIERLINDLETAKRNLEKTIITSPIAGTVVEVPVKEGDSITSEMKLMKVVDFSNLYIKTHVSESEIGNVQIGNPVVIKGSSLKDTTLAGKIMSIDPGAVQIEGKRQSYVPVKVSMAARDSVLRPDFLVDLEVETAKKTGVMAVKFEAIQKDENGEQFVEIYRPEGSRKVTVTTGIEGEIYTEILTGDVKVGDLLLMGSDYLEEPATEGLFDL